MNAARLIAQMLTGGQMRLPAQPSAADIARQKETARARAASVSLSSRGQPNSIVLSRNDDGIRADLERAMRDP
jgi:hypothetical protein